MTSEAIGSRDVLFIGHTRFSVYSYGSSGLKLARSGSEEDYRKQLYGPERMEPRVRSFLDESLPMLHLAQQEAQVDLVHVVSYSPSLPEQYRNELEAAAERYDFVQLHEVDRAVGALIPSAKVVQAAAQWRQGEHRKLGLYRLDDDDVLAADYFTRMRPHVEREDPGTWVSFGLGATALRSGGEYYFLREDYQPLATPGLLAVALLDEEGELHGARAANHRETDRHFPILLDSRHLSFFRPRHSRQDSLGKRLDIDVSFARSFERVQNRPSTDIEAFKAAFPVLQNHLAPRVADFPDTPAALTDTHIDATPHSLPLPSAGGFVVEIVPDEDLEAGAIRVYLTLAATGEKEITHKAIRGRLRRRNVRRDLTSSYYLATADAEKGQPTHVLFNVPAETQLTGLHVQSGKQAKVAVRTIRVYPPLHPEP